MTPDSAVRRSDSMIFTDLDDIVVMMDAEEGRYYELDPIGTRIWTLLRTERSVADLCDRLVEEYEVTPDECRRDVLAFLEEAAGLGIVEVRAAAAAAGTG